MLYLWLQYSSHTQIYTHLYNYYIGIYVKKRKEKERWYWQLEGKELNYKIIFPKTDLKLLIKDTHHCLSHHHLSKDCLFLSSLWKLYYPVYGPQQPLAFPLDTQDHLVRDHDGASWIIQGTHFLDIHKHCNLVDGTYHHQARKGSRTITWPTIDHFDKA